MEGLVLPVLVFLAACLALAAWLGALPAWQRGWARLRLRKLLQVELPGSHYIILQDVELPGDKATLAIDLVVVSAYGIFVIKQIDGNGSISGKPADARWYRKTRRGQVSFANPLFECLAQVTAVRELLGLDPSLLNFVLVFTGEVKFTSPMPVNVTRLDGLPLFIEGRDRLVIDFDVLPVLADCIRAAKPSAPVVDRRFQAAPR
ncbi:MAG TPA: nuclease-related domain-containing protein [Xanthomonadales bacterium]|nr:nuclease-related domain-containing protein [Xanthomonadales bacterium]